MNPQNNRAQRVAEQIRRTLADIISKQIHDLDKAFVSLTAVKLSPDLSTAKIYVTTLVADDERNTTIDNLNEASSFLRRELSQQINLRQTPKLTFVYDDSIENGSEMEKLINSAIKEDISNSNGQT